MKKLVIAMMAVALLAGVAWAEGKPALEKPEDTLVISASYAEVEPNNTAATANPTAAEAKL